MQFLFVAVLIYSMYRTAKEGVPAAARATKAAAGRRMDTWRKLHPDASTPAIFGHRAAAWAAALRYGPGYLKRELATAWKASWEDGKARYGLTPTFPPGTDEPASPTEPKPAPQDPQADPAPTPPEGQPPHLHLVTDHNGKAPTGPTPEAPPNASAPVSLTKGPNMAIRTATGGEVTTPEMLFTEVKTIRDEAVADREDAAGDSRRATEDLARIDRMVACLRSGKVALPKDDIAVIIGLKDPAARRRAATAARLAAADARLAQATAALKVAAKHVQFQAAGAAGTFYGNASRG